MDLNLVDQPQYMGQACFSSWQETGHQDNVHSLDDVPDSPEEEHEDREDKESYFCPHLPVHCCMQHCCEYCCQSADDLRNPFTIPAQCIFETT